MIFVNGCIFKIIKVQKEIISIDLANSVILVISNHRTNKLLQKLTNLCNNDYYFYFRFWFFMDCHGIMQYHVSRNKCIIGQKSVQKVAAGK